MTKGQQVFAPDNKRNDDCIYPGTVVDVKSPRKPSQLGDEGWVYKVHFRGFGKKHDSWVLGRDLLVMADWQEEIVNECWNLAQVSRKSEQELDDKFYEIQSVLGWREGQDGEDEWLVWWAGSYMSWVSDADLDATARREATRKRVKAMCRKSALILAPVSQSPGSASGSDAGAVATSEKVMSHVATTTPCQPTAEQHRFFHVTPSPDNLHVGAEVFEPAATTPLRESPRSVGGASTPPECGADASAEEEESGPSALPSSMEYPKRNRSTPKRFSFPWFVARGHEMKAEALLSKARKGTLGACGEDSVEAAKLRAAQRRARSLARKRADSNHGHSSGDKKREAAVAFVKDDTAEGGAPCKRLQKGPSSAAARRTPPSITITSPLPVVKEPKAAVKPSFRSRVPTLQDRKFAQRFDNGIIPLLKKMGWRVEYKETDKSQNKYFFSPCCDVYRSRSSLVKAILHPGNSLGNGLRTPLLDTMNEVYGSDGLKQLGVDPCSSISKSDPAEDVGQRMCPREEPLSTSAMSVLRRTVCSPLPAGEVSRAMAKSTATRAPLRLAVHSRAASKLSPNRRRKKEIQLPADNIDSQHTTMRRLCEKDLSSQATNNSAVNGGCVKKIVLSKDSGATTFLSWWADKHVLQYDVDLACHNLNGPGKTTTENGEDYALISSKKVEESGGYGWHGREVKIQLQYVKNNRDLQEKLENIADFKSLLPHKAVARLELFQTPSKKNGKNNCFWVHLKSSQFEDIPETFHLGCGFIPEEFLQDLLGNNALAKRTFAIQVRIFAPQLGVYKGVLVAKQGITKMQLPGSMKKVGKSTKNSDDAGVVMLARAFFPSTMNYNLGRFLDPQAVDPPASFEDDFIKPLSKTYCHYLEGMGVPKELIERYKRTSKNRHGLKHAHLIGL